VSLWVGDPQHPGRMEFVGMRAQRLLEGNRVLDEQNRRVGLGEGSGLHAGAEVADRVEALRRLDPHLRLGAYEHLLGGGLAHRFSSPNESCSQVSHIPWAASPSTAGANNW